MADTTETLPEGTNTETTSTAVAGGDGKLNQKVEISDVGPCKKHVKISVNRGDIDGRFKEKFDELLKDKSTTLPGFRPGKAPRKFVEKKYHSTVAEDVRREILMASLQQLAEDSNLSPLAPPDLKPDQLELPEEGDFIYEFDIEVRPEFDLPSFKGLKLRRPTRNFTDAEVTTSTIRLARDFGKGNVKPADSGKVDKNDQILVDFVVSNDGTELRNVKDVSIDVEDQLAFVDGVAENFSKQIVGAKVGETRDIEVKMAARVANEALRGKTLICKMTVKQITEINVKEITPTLMSALQLSNEEMLHEFVRASMERQFEYNVRQNLRNQIFIALLKDTKIELPPDLLVRQAKRALSRKILEMRSSGIPDAQINGQISLLQQDAIQNTVASLHEHFMLQKIADLEKIEIQDPDIDEEIHRIAVQSGESYRKVRANLEKEDMLESLATELLERKALDVVLNNAEYEDYEYKAGSGAGEVTSLDVQITDEPLVALDSESKAAEQPAVAG